MRQLFVVTLLLVISSPFVNQSAHPERIQSMLFTVVYVMALLAVGGNPQRLVWGSILVVPAIIGSWANDVWPELVPESVKISLAMLLLGYVLLHLLHYIVQTPRVDREVLFAAVSTYLILGIFWAMSFMLLSELYPNSYSIAGEMKVLDFYSALYFSFITLATVGYGDIVPNLPITRTLSYLEAIVGTFYMAILVARLVAQYSMEKTLIADDGQKS